MLHGAIGSFYRIILYALYYSASYSQRDCFEGRPMLH